MTRFWSSVLKGPERKLIPVTEAPGFQNFQSLMVAWLDSLFPGGWRLEKSAKNPHSETFLFQQTQCADIPSRIFVKRFVIRGENGDQLYSDGLTNESKILRQIARFNTENVFTPSLYGVNESLCAMAVKFIEGDQFFNVLFQSPIKAVIYDLPSKEMTNSLTTVGQWLCSVHAADPYDFDEVDAERTIESIIDSDLAAIEMRVRHLSSTRPTDFSQPLCRKIMEVSSWLARTIIGKNPSPRMVHGDFTLPNMLFDHGQLCILDHASFGLGMPEDDLCRIYLDFLNVEKYSYLFKFKARNSLSSAFFSGYGRTIDPESSSLAAFYLLKHSIINIYMYTIHWGNKSFLNPILCRLFYSFQKKFLIEVVNSI